MTVILAVSYGGREEIAEAVRAIAREVRRGELDPEDIDAGHGRRSISAPPASPIPICSSAPAARCASVNFLLWQIAYTEIYVTETLWPDFREAEFLEALSHFQRRERRFGRTPEQVERERIGAAR